MDNILYDEQTTQDVPKHQQKSIDMYNRKKLPRVQR
jgi:hypothetical protein